MDNKISFDDFLDSIKKAVEDMRSFVFKEIHSKFLELKKTPLDSTLGKILGNVKSLSIEFDFWKVEENEDGLPAIDFKIDGNYVTDQGLLYNLSPILKIIEDCLGVEYLEHIFENATYTVTDDQVSFKRSSFQNFPEKIIYKTSEVK